MKERSIARRYARGLIGAALASDGAKQLAEQIGSLAAVCDSAPAFIKALSDERLTVARRVEIAESCAKAMGLSRDVASALFVMVKRRRIPMLPLVAAEAQAMISGIEGRRRARLRVADASLAAEISARVEGLLSASTGCEVSCDVEVDPALIGGFEVRLGDMRFDASTAGKIARLKSMLYSRDKER